MPKPNYGRVRIHREPLITADGIVLIASILTFISLLTILIVFFPE
jgi:hypothetical protein